MKTTELTDADMHAALQEGLAYLQEPYNWKWLTVSDVCAQIRRQRTGLFTAGYEASRLGKVFWRQHQRPLKDHVRLYLNSMVAAGALRKDHPSDGKTSAPWRYRPAEHELTKAELARKDKPARGRIWHISTPYPQRPLCMVNRKMRHTRHTVNRVFWYAPSLDKVTCKRCMAQAKTDETLAVASLIEECCR